MLILVHPPSSPPGPMHLGNRFAVLDHHLHCQITKAQHLHVAALVWPSPAYPQPMASQAPGTPGSGWIPFTCWGSGSWVLALATCSMAPSSCAHSVSGSGRRWGRDGAVSLQWLIPFQSIFLKNVDGKQTLKITMI